MSGFPWWLGELLGTSTRGDKVCIDSAIIGNNYNTAQVQL